MNILHINASYKPAYIYGGPTMSVSELCEQLNIAGCNITVYTTTANGEHELPEAAKTPAIVNGVPVYYFKRVTKDHSHLSPFLLSKLWKTAKNFDAVHIHAWWNMVSVLSCLIALLRGVPVVVSPRGMLSLYTFNYRKTFFKSLFHWALGKRMLNRCAIHVTSGAEGESLAQVCRPESITEIFNFVDMPAVPPNKNKAGHILKLIYLSRVHPKKGLHILFKALPLINTEWQLTIVGNGDEAYINQLKQTAINLNVSDKITWAGFKGDEKFQLLADHDIMVLPSHNENFANVVIESLSVGTAVIITKTVGLAAYISKNSFGYVCDMDEFSLSDKINLLAAQPEKLAAIAQQAPQIIRHDFDNTQLSNKYLQMYQQVITQAKA